MRKIEHNMTIDVLQSPKVTIESENLGYRIKGGEGSKVTINAEIEFEPRRRDEEISAEDIFTMEKNEDENHVVITIDDPEVRQIKAKILVTVPSETILEAISENGGIHIDEVKLVSGKVESENGSLTLSDVGGDIELETENGSVRCAKVKGALAIETDNGSCKLVECEGARIGVATDNGSITCIRMNFPEIEMQTDNGKIFYEFTPLEAGKATFKTDNGKIQTVIPEGVDYDIHAITDNGRFFVGLGGEYLIKNTHNGKEFQKTRGSGKVKIDIETDNGSIVMSNKLLNEKSMGHDSIAEGVQTGMRHALKVVAKVIGTIGGELENVDFGISPEDQQKVMSKIQKVGEKLQKASEKIQEKTELDQEKLTGLDNLGEELSNLGTELKIKLSDLGRNTSETVRKELHNLHDSPEFNTFVRRVKREVHDLQESPEWKTIIRRVKREKVREVHEEKQEDQHQSRVQILQMLQEGKLSVEEAERLLKAIEN